MPASLDVAFAGTVAPAAASPMNATATAVLVIAPRTPEAIVGLIHGSSRADPYEPR
jgi:hypothetical protein